jgi:hypothetical protein
MNSWFIMRLLIVVSCFILTVMLNGQTMYLVKLCIWLSFCKRAFALLYYVTFDSSIIFYFDGHVEWICCVMFPLYLPVTVKLYASFFHI